MVESLEAYRPLLFSIAYRMLGSATDAEDIAQEAFVRYAAVTMRDGEAAVRSPKALLTTITTRLCLDELKSARVRRERYVGPWLPEPVMTEDGPLSPLETVEQRESISLGFLALLERLSPAERAVFVLREAFDYAYDEIASALGRTAQTCRQLHHRASRHLAEARPRFQSVPEAHRLLVEQFVAAANGGDVRALEGLLATDAVLISDGGGKAAAALNPIHGFDRIIRFLVGIGTKAPADTRTVLVEVNGELAFLTLVGDQPIAVSAVELVDGRIQTIRAVVNPDKLAYFARQLHGRPVTV
jgi:RNA polymerase sigma-70 factor (TIGR02957 family)